MNLAESIAYVRDYQAWRRGDNRTFDEAGLDIKKLGDAIDNVLKAGETAHVAQAELAAVRAIFPEVLAALESGMCSADCSVEFLREIPREVGLVVKGLRAVLAAAEERVAELERDGQDMQQQLLVAVRQRNSAEAKIASLHAVVPHGSVVIEVAIADASAEPIHLELDGKPVAKLTPDAAARLADNLLAAVTAARAQEGGAK